MNKNATEFAEKLIKLTELRQATVRNGQRKQIVRGASTYVPAKTQPPRPQTYKIYTQGKAFHLALRGFDFLPTELKAYRQRFVNYLTRFGYTERAAKLEAGKLSRAWDFAAFSYRPPTDQPCAYLQLGKAFLSLHGPKTMTLDLRPDSVGWKIYSHAREVKTYSERSQFHGKFIDYRSLFKKEGSNHEH